MEALMDRVGRGSDAVEKMGASYPAILNDRDFYKRRYEEQSAYARKLERTITAHKANYTRLKSKLEYATTHTAVA